MAYFIQLVIEGLATGAGVRVSQIVIASPATGLPRTVAA